jgi:microcystin-dependent protein
MFSGNFAPRGWALCDGQLLAISAHPKLFQLIGNAYGGDGRTTFGLPDLRGRFAIQQGAGPGLSNHTLGEKGGAEQLVLTAAQMPAHSHAVACTEEEGEDMSPVDKFPAYATEDVQPWAGASDGSEMNAGMIKSSGSSQPVNISGPFLTISFIIAVEGIVPARS